MTRESSPRFSRNKTWISQLCFPLVCSAPLLTSRCLDSNGDAEQLSSLPSQHTHQPITVRVQLKAHAASFIPDICLFTPPLALFTRTAASLTPDTCLFTQPWALFLHTRYMSVHTTIGIVHTHCCISHTRYMPVHTTMGIVHTHCKSWNHTKYTHRYLPNSSMLFLM